MTDYKIIKLQKILDFTNVPEEVKHAAKTLYDSYSPSHNGDANQNTESKRKCLEKNDEYYPLILHLPDYIQNLSTRGWFLEELNDYYESLSIPCDECESVCNSCIEYANEEYNHIIRFKRLLEDKDTMPAIWQAFEERDNKCEYGWVHFESSAAFFLSMIEEHIPNIWSSNGDEIKQQNIIKREIKQDILSLLNKDREQRVIQFF